MSTIEHVPSNEIYSRVQSNTAMDKPFKKATLNLYKRHPKVAEHVLDVIETIRDKNIVPKGSMLADGRVYFRDESSIDITDGLYTDILEKYLTYIQNAVNILAVHLQYKWKKLPHDVIYYLIEMEDGTFKEIYHADKKRQKY